MPLGIGDPAEPADTLHVLRLGRHVRALGAQLGEHRVEVADPEVEHGLLVPGPEVARLGLERREHRRPAVLTPEAVLVGVQAQAFAVPGAESLRVTSAQEVPTDPEHAFHAASLPAPRPRNVRTSASPRPRAKPQGTAAASSPGRWPSPGLRRWS